MRSSRMCYILPEVHRSQFTCEDIKEVYQEEVIMPATPDLWWEGSQITNYTLFVPFHCNNINRLSNVDTLELCHNIILKQFLDCQYLFK